MKADKYLSWKCRSGDLVIGDQTVSSVVRRFGTPLYLYDSGLILNRLRIVKEAFPGFDISFSVKSNPNPYILALLSKNGCYADVASPLELKSALENGFTPEVITYGGPGKRSSDLEAAVKAKVGIIDVESRRELQILDELGTEYQKSVSATLRVNTSYRPVEAGEIMTGEPTKFGFDEEILAKEMTHIPREVVQLRGIHVHVASQVLDSSVLLNHYKRTAELSRALSLELGFDLGIINFGGGIGVPYSTNESPVDLFYIGTETAGFLSTLFSGTHRGPNFQLELGRFLVAESGIFLTKVIEVKQSRGINFVITDSGISGLSRPAMAWAQQHPCTIVSKCDTAATDYYKVVGPSCLAADVLCEKVELPDPQPGDILAIHNAGAYGFTMSLILWASQSIPKEVVFIDGEFALAKTIVPSNYADGLTRER